MRTVRVMFMALVIMCGMTACSHRDYTVTSADEALRQRLGQIVITQGWLDYSLGGAVMLLGSDNNVTVVLDPDVGQDLAKIFFRLEVRRLSLAETLTEILKPKGLTYEVRGGAIHVSRCGPKLADIEAASGPGRRFRRGTRSEPGGVRVPFVELISEPNDSTRPNGNR